MSGLAFEMGSHSQKCADAIVDIAEHYLASSDKGQKQHRAGQRYEVILHIDRNRLTAADVNGESARYYAEPDWGVDDEAARRIMCDAEITNLLMTDPALV